MTYAYKAAFPDFDNSAFFEAVGRLLAPLGFEDGSWRDDENPKWILDLSDDQTTVWVSVFVEYASPESRQYECVAVTLNDFESEEVAECVDVFDAMAVLGAARRYAEQAHKLFDAAKSQRTI